MSENIKTNGSQIIPILPVSVSSVNMVFGGDIEKLLPKYEDVPEEFKSGSYSHKWIKLFNTWFMQGLPENTDFIPKEGIDPKAALRHIAAIMRSWEPKHEHKEAGCAYLLSLWFSDVIIPEKKKE